MWYAIYRNQNDDVVGFILDDADAENHVPSLPVKFISEGEGHDKLKGHVLYPLIDFIEL